MLKKLLSLLLVVMFLIGTNITVSATDRGPIAPIEPGPSVGIGEMVDETPLFWFVELSSLPKAAGGNSEDVRNEKRNFRASAQEAGIDYIERFSFDNLWNGLSISVDPSQLAKLRNLKGVKAIYPVVMVSLPPTSLSPELAYSLAMIGADVVQSELGYTGEGVRVAVMDTGVDYDHPDLGGCFGLGCRVEVGYDFVGDAFDGTNMPVPDPDPDDCNGHGTHVAGIIGADGDITGVAPGVTFGAYRVFGCAGYTWSDIMIAAMERALDDKMDVLNMSIGAAFQWPQYPTAVAADRLVKKGMVVVAAIGNSGDYGAYSADAPGVGEDVIGVASFDNTHVTLKTFEVDGQSIGYIPMSGSPPPPTSGTDEIVYVGRACDLDLPLLEDPNGKVALIERGFCSFREKAINAISEGATRVVIHNNIPGVFYGTVGAPPLSDPVLGIDQASGLFIRSLATPVMMTWTDDTLSTPDPYGGLISSFSAYGLSPDLDLKPDIGAPGGNIYSTYPLELGGFESLGGTSMATPHVAGAAALFIEAHPRVLARDIRTILQNSSDPAPWWGWPAGPFLDNVHRQGAGMLDIDDAILATTIITPGKLALGESAAGPVIRTLKIRNNSDDSVTYDLTFVSAVGTSGTFQPLGYWLTDESVTFS